MVGGVVTTAWTMPSRETWTRPLRPSCAYRKQTQSSCAPSHGFAILILRRDLPLVRANRTSLSCTVWETSIIWMARIEHGDAFLSATLLFSACALHWEDRLGVLARRHSSSSIAISIIALQRDSRVMDFELRKNGFSIMLSNVTANALALARASWWTISIRQHMKNRFRMHCEVAQSSPIC